MLIVVFRFLAMGLQLLCGAIYFYTIYIAYVSSGIIAAIISAAMPVFANVYWMYEITMDTGDLMNNYNLVHVIFGIYFAVFLIISMLIEKISNE